MNYKILMKVYSVVKQYFVMKLNVRGKKKRNRFGCALSLEIACWLETYYETCFKS